MQLARRTADRDAAALRLDHLEAQLTARERELAGFKTSLQTLLDRYLKDVGVHYRELNAIEAHIAQIEVRLGVRSPDDLLSGAGEVEADGDGRAETTPAEPAADGLKEMFRDVAKAIHPDLALDEESRCRQHSLMAEANRAYKNRDLDRLRLILHTWERSADVISSDDPDEVRRLTAKKIAEIETRLLGIDTEFADLRASAIYALKLKIDDARAKGWDLFAEMVLETRRDVARAAARLQSLRATHGGS